MSYVVGVHQFVIQSNICRTIRRLSPICSVVRGSRRSAETGAIRIISHLCITRPPSDISGVRSGSRWRRISPGPVAPSYGSSKRISLYVGMDSNRLPTGGQRCKKLLATFRSSDNIQIPNSLGLKLRSSLDLDHRVVLRNVAAIGLQHSLGTISEYLLRYSQPCSHKALQQAQKSAGSLCANEDGWFSLHQSIWRSDTDQFVPNPGLRRSAHNHIESAENDRPTHVRNRSSAQRASVHVADQYRGTALHHHTCVHGMIAESGSRRHYTSSFSRCCDSFVIAS